MRFPRNRRDVCRCTGVDHLQCIAYNFLAATYSPELPHFGPCAMTGSEAVVGIGITTSYFLFFRCRPIWKLAP
ncbi:hypothetical protein SCLCIDRAFT_911817 [Scleroderma citrinum Foug A]|uniref:Uncharacterized protein n=1 Tax=Scleroderma citrinum Foug A TaxID=1036808 RepID=A0A0C3DYG1_9AGAM|nr:hypothetical protein SCLCIDRAFT_911817 [Scleroderma citrinum Foug A]